jgi:thiol-disulfide isomerase/thioredoxin
MNCEAITNTIEKTCMSVRKYAVFIFLTCLGLQANCSPLDSTYTLTGKIEGLPDGWVWLYHSQTDKDMDSGRVKGGNFIIKGHSSAPEHCLLGIQGKEGKEFRFGFWLQPGELSLTGNKDSIWTAAVSGSPTQDESTQFKAGQKDLDAAESQLDKLYDQARAKNDKPQMDSIEKAFNDLDQHRRAYVKEYAAAHPSSYVAAYAIYTTYVYNPQASELRPLYKGLDPVIQSSYFGRQVKASLDAAELTEIGQPAPAFVQNDPNGKPISLASFKGKYVLLDFWASWCGPCRAENPNVVAAYQKYSPKGFTILGVSLDNNKDKWLAAVKKDQLAWTQVSDLKGWQNKVADLYGIKGIPMNYLLDRDGKIIAKGLRGEDLEKKLDELMK